jgi:hypothetical protein
MKEDFVMSMKYRSLYGYCSVVVDVACGNGRVELLHRNPQCNVQQHGL